MNGQVVKPVEAKSSPSHINATKGSSVWLHWNYTYPGDGPQGLATIFYKEQLIRFSSTSQPAFQILANKTGQNGILRLESPVSAPFTGRVEVIFSNSTLAIHNLQYNDSNYQFSSTVEVRIDAGSTVYPLIPTVTLATIQGMNIYACLFYYIALFVYFIL